MHVKKVFALLTSIFYTSQISPMSSVGPDKSLAIKLAQIFAPQMYVAKDEKYFPSSINRFIEGSALVKNSDVLVPQGKVNQEKLSTYANKSEKLYLIPSKQMQDKIYQGIKPRGGVVEAPVYTHVFFVPDEDRIIIQYWLFFGLSGPPDVNASGFEQALIKHLESKYVFDYFKDKKLIPYLKSYVQLKGYVSLQKVPFLSWDNYGSNEYIACVQSLGIFKKIGKEVKGAAKDVSKKSEQAAKKVTDYVTDTGKQATGKSDQFFKDLEEAAQKQTGKAKESLLFLLGEANLLDKIKKEIKKKATHQGDWENITVYISQAEAKDRYSHSIAGKRYKVDKVFYSQHGQGQVVYPNKLTMVQNTHPVGYIAYGSHAVYPHTFSGFNYYLDKVDNGYSWPGWKRVELIALNNNFWTQSWVKYPGTWGSTGAPRGPMYHSVWLKKTSRVYKTIMVSTTELAGQASRASAVFSVPGKYRYDRVRFDIKDDIPLSFALLEHIESGPDITLFKNLKNGSVVKLNDIQDKKIYIARVSVPDKYKKIKKVSCDIVWLE